MAAQYLVIGVERGMMQMRDAVRPACCASLYFESSVRSGLMPVEMPTNVRGLIRSRVVVGRRKPYRSGRIRRRTCMCSGRLGRDGILVMRCEGGAERMGRMRATSEGRSNCLRHWCKRKIHEQPGRRKWKSRGMRRPILTPIGWAHKGIPGASATNGTT